MAVATLRPRPSLGRVLVLFAVCACAHAYCPRAVRGPVDGVLASSFKLKASRDDPLMASRRALVGAVMGLTIALPRLSIAQAAEKKISHSGFDLTPLTPAQIAQASKELNELQQRILLRAGTEFAFSGQTTNGYSWNNKQEGVYVSPISGLPLFSSATKYNSGTGWPSFWAPIDPEHVIERLDPKDAGLPSFLQRVEVLDAKSGAHLGHVFDDGPAPTYKRYCMNANALTFVPAGSQLPLLPLVDSK